MDSLYSLPVKKQELESLIRENTAESNGMVLEVIQPLSPQDISHIAFTHGENLLHWCAAYNNLEIGEYLMTHFPYLINLMNSRSVTPLCYGALKNNFEIVELLLRNGADVRIRNGFSGLVPVDITTNKAIKDLIRQYEERIPLDYDNNYRRKEIKTLSQCYQYRSFLFYNILLTASFLKSNGCYNTTSSSIEETKSMKEIVTNHSFDEILEMFLEVLRRYQQGLLFPEGDLNVPSCLSCQGTENLQRCGRCKQVYFCNRNCQRKCFELHNLDCKP
jgi:hypothetical protein